MSNTWWLAYNFRIGYVGTTTASHSTLHRPLYKTEFTFPLNHPSLMVSSLVRWYSDSFRERNWSIPSKTACTVYAIYELILSVKLRGEISYWRRIVSVSLTLSLSLFFSILFKDFSFSISMRSRKDIHFTKSPVCNRDTSVYTLTIDITQKPTNRWGKTKKKPQGETFWRTQQNPKNYFRANWKAETKR